MDKAIDGHAVVPCGDEECIICQPGRHHLFRHVAWLEHEAKSLRRYAEIWQQLGSAAAQQLAPVALRAAAQFERTAQELSAELARLS